MDSDFADLDMMLVKVRDPKSRSYFMDAIRAYRSGALRPAIAATWVAVAYDIIGKYRELASRNDAEARSYVTDWDKAVQTGTTARLLELERTLLKHAFEKMQMIDRNGFSDLVRLQEDRHKCAHPAFANETQLFHPTPELVRLHLGNAVQLMLAQPAVQGKSLLDEFDADIVSPGFPVNQPDVADYVEDKYLNRIRERAIPNLALVLAKSLLKNTPENWAAVDEKVINSLIAIKDRRTGSWPEIEVALVATIDGLEPHLRTNILGFLGCFPSLAERLQPATMVSLRAIVAADDANTWAARNFKAVDIPAFAAEIVGAFARLEDKKATAVLLHSPSLAFWPSAVFRYRNSGGFRSSELNFDQFVSPFQRIIRTVELDQLLEAISANGQNWDAAQTNTKLSNFLGGTNGVRPSDASLNTFYSEMKKRNMLQSYLHVFKDMEYRGWAPPELLPDPLADFL